MTKKQIEYRVSEVIKLEAQIKALEEKKSKYKKELQEEMTSLNQSVIEACGKTVKNTLVESNKFDSKKLKADMPEVYDKYVTCSSYYRFSIS